MRSQLVDEIMYSGHLSLQIDTCIGLTVITSHYLASIPTRVVLLQTMSSKVIFLTDKHSVAVELK
jgi:hypothetical protein